MMKKFILVAAVMFISLSVAQECPAQTTARNDSTVTALRLKTLRNRKESLQREIKVQDAKRNRQIAGVTPETMEEMNDRQDSVCLALRSELVDVILEIKEISSDITTPQLLDSYNNLIHRQDSVNGTQAQTDASQSRPVKKKTNKK